MNKWVFIFILIFYSTSLECQKYNKLYKFQRFTTENGLPCNTIFSITEDWEGNIILGTDNGLSFFNGLNFENLNTKDGVLNPYITSVFADWSDKRIYITCYGAGHQYFYQKKFYTISSSNNKYANIYATPSKLFLPLMSIANGIYEYPIRELWNQVILKPNLTYLEIYPKDQMKMYLKMLNEKFPLFGNGWGEIAEIDSNGKMNTKYGTFSIPYLGQKIYFVFYNQYYSFTFSGNKLTVADKNEKIVFVHTIPIDIFKNSTNIHATVDSYGNLWFTIQKYGLWKLGIEKNKWSLEKINEKLSLSNSQNINALYTDRMGKIWIGTNQNGLYKIDNQNTTIYSIPNEESIFYSAAYTPQKGLFFGTNYSIYKLENHSLAKQITLQNTFKLKEFDSSIYVLSMNQDVKKHPLLTFLLGDNFYWYKNRRYTFRKNELYNTPEIKNSPYLIPKGVLNSQRFYQIWNKNDTLYGNIGNKIVRMTLKGIEMHYIDSLPLPKIGFISNALPLQDTIILGADNTIYWFFKKIIKKLNSINGVKIGQISKIKIIKNTLWICSDKGLFGLLQSGKGIVINSHNFLPDNFVNDIVIDSNFLWVCSNNGLTQIPIKSIFENKVKPILKSIIIDTLKFSPNNNISINLTHNSEIQNLILDISLQTAEKNLLIEYKLNNSNWEPINTNQIFLSGLGYGSHKLSIRLKDVNSEWNFYNIKICKQYPFYLQWWFILAMILISIFIILKIQKNRHDKELEIKKKEAQLEQKIISLRQNALTAMMNPHFIFNSLNAIQYFVNSNQKEKSTEYLAKFARLVRLFLNHASKSTISLEEELDRLKKYVELEKVRFYPFEFNINLNLANSIKEIYIPNMILQPFIENAIIHGISHLVNKDGKIELNIFEKESIMIIEIIDNGYGIEYAAAKENSHISKSIQIISERIELLNTQNSKEYFVKFENANSEIDRKGWKVSIRCPKEIFKHILSN